MNIKLMRGVPGMENTIIKETTDIFNRLTPKNQTYFMILVRLAEAAENGAKHRDAIRQSCGSSRLIAPRQENESKEN